MGDTLHNLNIDNVLGASEPALSRNLTRLFAKLLERNQDHTYVQNYTGAIKLKLRKEASQEVAVRKFSVFGNACFKAGIVKVMLELATLHVYTTAYPQERYIAQYNGLDSLMGLMRSGNLAERRALLDEMLQHGAVDIFMQKLDHPLCIIRQLAVNLIRLLSTESMLGEKISAATTAEIMIAMCQFALEGPEFYIQQMQSPVVGWQSQMILGSPGIPSSQAVAHAPRYYAMAQESSLWAIHGLLCTNPLPPRKFCLEILKRKPEVLDLLFDCAILPRPPWYPETQADSIACEALGLLLQWPSHIVPGVSTPMDSAFKAQDWKAMSQCLTILTSREGWAEKIIEIWMKIEEEDSRVIKRLLDRVETDYLAIEPPDLQTYHQIFEYRGTSRIAVLRLIATLTHAAESCGITNAELESFLHIAYMASRRIKPKEECKTKADDLTRIERTMEIFRSPLYTVPLRIKMDAPARIADEGILGPTALARLLVVLAQRKALGTIQGLKKPPSGLSSSTSLNHVQQITHPDVIRRFISIALQRVRATANKGRERVGQAEYDFARTAFTNTAELAAALVALDTHTQGQYSEEIRGARKELVLALGNASEMALRRKQYQEALNFGHGAVTVAENIAASEGLDPTIVAKNRRRVQQAQREMSQK
ncbi:hypothetical protein BDN67DRAFT_906453 [Paxillus ammoniavirescens]|nr:hypothetical protein BDN67DRAFT_906453 [Paxillus ammoniavirescens]